MGETINSEGLRIPEHIGIIMDGNGRWAKKRFLPRNAGHVQGSKIVENVCDMAYNMGVKYLTIYAFSTENWKRPKSEVDALMTLLGKYLKDCIKTSKKNNMRVRVIGDISKLNEGMQKSIVELEEVSSANTGLNFTVALNYGSRDEMVRAIKKISSDVAENKISIDDIDESSFGEYLDTKGIPDVDLLIRTSGEQRISNFLLWQIAYSELYFTDTLWPEYGLKDLKEAIEFYNTKERRFGDVK